MNVIIIEDETSAARNLCDLLHEINPAIHILVVLETIRDSIRWINDHTSPDLAFFDIKIADGSSFEIFEKITIQFPVIFTTAYNEYALKAFKYNSIDYLLKPVNKGELQKSITKYNTLFISDKSIADNNARLLSLVEELKQNTIIYKRTFLVSYRDQLIPISTHDIAYFYLKNELVYCVVNTGVAYRIEQTLEKIQKQLDPLIFFRANRQHIIAKKAIRSVTSYEKRKLKLKVFPEYSGEIIVSKLKATDLKNWLRSV